MTTKTASASLEKRLQANPDSLVFSRLAEYCRKSGDIARAIELCISGNEKHPEYVTGRIVLGRCYADLENFESAVEAFSNVCRLDRHNMVAMKMLADGFMRLGEREKAGALYSQLAVIDPWNETLSQMAVRMRGPGTAPQPEIPGPAPLEKAPERPAALPKAVPEKGPPAVIETAATFGPAQKVTQRESGIPEPAPAEKAEAALETAENSTAEETFSEATTVTGNDITDRMAMLFGESGAGEKQATEVSPRVEQETAGPPAEDTIETIEVQPIDAIPDGNTILSRIDELFSRETLKMPAIKEAAGKKGAERTDAAGETLAAAPAAESEFEETMIMDAAEVKGFLSEDTVMQGPLLKTAAGTEKQQPDLISDDRSDAVVMGKEAVELVVDENDTSVGGVPGRSDGGSPEDSAATGDTVTGDDVVRLMTGFFEDRDDKAIAEIVGPETVDDFFEEAGFAAGPGAPLPEGPLAVDSPSSATTVEPRQALAEEGEIEATVVEGDTKDTAQAPPEVTVGDTAALPEHQKEQGEEAAALDDDAMISGDDVAGKIDGMFSQSEVEQVAGPPEERGAKPGREDTRVVDAGRPSETDVIEDTVVESAGIISGSDIEDRLDEYFQGPAKPAGKKGPLVSDEETVRQDPGQPGTMVDKKAEYEEMVIAGDIDAIDLASDTIDGKETVSSPGTGEEALVGPAVPPGETAPELAVQSDAPVSGKEDENEATAVFTDFSPVSDAPPPPPEVPLFTTQTPCSLDEETIITQPHDIAAAGAGPSEPDIPDHVLTPTLADIYFQQGQPRRALEIYRRLKEKNLDNEKLDARMKEIETALAEGIVAAPPSAQLQKPAASRSRKKAAGDTIARQKKGREDPRPLAGVRLKKRPGTNLKK